MFAIFILFVVFHSSTAAIRRLNESDHARMPPLFHLDNYEECFYEADAIYCSAEFILLADETNDLFTMVKEYAEYPTHYNRTLLRHGYCMNKSCKKFYNETEVDLTLSLEACANETLYNKYKMKAIVKNVDCSKRDREQPFDVSDFVVGVIFISIVLANVVGTLCDAYLDKRREHGGLRYLYCFSLSRNWKKFITAPGEGGDSRLKALRGIHGFRAITMICVVSSHVGFIAIMFNSNPHEVEDLYDNKLHTVFLSGTLVMQTFLVISSFLLVYNWLIYLEKHSLSWGMLPHQIIMRWLRLTPPYALILGLTITWLPKATPGGPYWKESVQHEVVDCRRDWWKHLFYVNNYFDGSHCLPHTWYLAADTQLYIAGVIIFLICRTGLTRKVGLSLLFVAGLIIPPLHVYYQGLNGVLIQDPEIAMRLFADNPTFDHIFKRGHTNLVGCIIGMAAGYILYYWQQNDGEPSKFRKYRYLYWSLFFWGALICFSGSVFYQSEEKVPLYIHLLFAALMKPAFGLMIALTLAGLVIQFEGLYRPVLEWRPFVYIGRLSYSAYLLHTGFIRNEVSSITALHRVSIYKHFLKGCTVVTGTFIAAFVFYLMAESPMGNLIREFFRKPNKETKEDNKEVEAAEKPKKIEGENGKDINQTRVEDGATVVHI